MYKTLVVFACLLALSLALPAQVPQNDSKKTDKRSIGYHYDTEAEVGYHSVPVVHNVQVPVTKHITVPVTSSVSVPVVKSVHVPVVNYRSTLHYDTPVYYGYGSYGHGYGYNLHDYYY